LLGDQNSSSYGEIDHSHWSTTSIAVIYGAIYGTLSFIMMCQKTSSRDMELP
jgi:hypothetical protein